MAHRPISDGELAEQFRDGSDMAFVKLYNRYKRSVYGYCLKMLGDGDEAKDIVQSVFLKVYEERARLNSPDRFKGWLFTITHNACLTSRRHLRFYDNGNGGLERSAVEPSHDEFSRKEESEIVRRVIAGLKPEYREVLILREYQEFSYREIADVVGSTESAVKSRLFAARRRLHECLKPFFEERG